MRIAVGGVHVECSTYNPVPTREEDFTILRGRNLSEASYFAFLKDYAADFAPLLHARAIAGGPVTRRTYEDLKAGFLGGLARAGPLDGVYLAMHGAMFVEGLEDAEGDWIAATRALVGPGPLIAASYDLHGNLSQPIIDAIDMFSAYRTAPHIDVEETMRRTVTMLVRALAGGPRPRVVWRPIPVLMPGERTSTDDEPARGLYGRLATVDARPGVWDASLMVGYVWADEPRATAAAVLTGVDGPALAEEADRLAQAYWEARDSFGFGDRTGSIEDCVDWAMTSAARPFVIADSGDNPTGGGVGDRPDLLRELLRRGARDAILAGVADRAATERAYAVGVGGRLTGPVGASLDPQGGPPVTVDGEVVALAATDDPAERQAVLRVGGVKVVVAARRRPYHRLADLTVLGLAPASAAILAVKSGYLSPQIKALARGNAMALSPGVVDQDVARLVRRRKVRPTFPFDREFAWRPGDGAPPGQ